MPPVMFEVSFMSFLVKLRRSPALVDLRSIWNLYLFLILLTGQGDGPNIVSAPGLSFETSFRAVSPALAASSPVSR